MRKKKNGFMTFIFSFIPGCAEMYWGYMKNGVSILALFCASVFLSGIFGNGAFMLLAVVVYAYAFFHARNMAHMSDEEFAETEDAYLISEEKISPVPGSGADCLRLLVPAGYGLVSPAEYFSGHSGCRLDDSEQYFENFCSGDSDRNRNPPDPGKEGAGRCRISTVWGALPAESC